MVVGIGDPFPNILLSLKGQDVFLHDRLKDQHAIILGCTGAFSKQSTAIIEGYKFLAPTLRESGKIAFIGCLAVNDPIVLKAWAKKVRIGDEIVFISDANGTLTKSLGLQVTDQVQKTYGGHSKRCRYFVAVLAPGGKISHLYVDDYTVAPSHEVCRIFNIRLTHDQEQQLHAIMDGGEVVKLTGKSKSAGPCVVPGLCSLPFLSPKSLIVKDISRPSVRTDYAMSEEIHQWILRRWSTDGICRIYPGVTLDGELITEPGEPTEGGAVADFGTLLLESDRSRLFDDTTGARLANVETPRKNTELEYEAQFIVIDTNNVLPLSSSTPIGTLAIVHSQLKRHDGSPSARMANDADEYAILVMPLLPGGRDNFLASIHEWITSPSHRKDSGASGAGLVVPPDKNIVIPNMLHEVGVNLNKYTYPFMKLYKYSAPCIYTKDQASATWLVCEEPCYVDSQHLNCVRSQMAPRRSQGLMYSASMGFVVAAD